MSELKIMKAPTEMIDPQDIGVSLSNLGGNWFLSEKLDGYHCVIKDGEILSSSMKRTFINPLFLHLMKPLVDFAEEHRLVLCGELYAGGDFGDLGAIRAKKPKPLPEGLQFHCFDALHRADWDHPREEAQYRVRRVGQLAARAPAPFRAIPQRVIRPGEYFVAEEISQKWMAAGGEGAMLLRASECYKHGRVSLNDARILKTKMFDNIDGVVTAVEEGLTIPEGVERKRGPTGRLEAVAKGSKVPSGTFGRFRIRITSGPFEGRETTVGRWKGYTDELGKKIFTNPDKYIGRHCRFRGMSGAKDLPRIPKDFAWRDEK